MGQLIDGVWHDTWYDTKSTGGKFQRSASAFRNWLALLAPLAQAVLSQRKIVIISMFHSPARGRTARCSCANSKDWNRLFPFP